MGKIDSAGPSPVLPISRNLRPFKLDLRLRLEQGKHSNSNHKNRSCCNEPGPLLKNRIPCDVIAQVMNV
jgi:hypothetical protein